MDWRKQYADKVFTPEDAVADVASGQSVTVGLLDGMPPSICRALSERSGELEDVTVFHFVSTVPWASFNDGKAFKPITPFLTNVDRAGVRDGSVDYLPTAIWRRGKLPYGVGPFDYHLCIVSPPDEDGWCSYGSSVWMNPTFAAHSDKVVAEVDEKAIRTGGANRIHVDRIARLVDADQTVGVKVRDAMRRAQGRKEEEVAQAEVICTLVGMDLIEDGDTVQIGAGSISAALAPFLAHRKDLGIHTELLTGGITDLVESGVVTGKHKTLHPGKVVATGLALLPQEEVDFIDGNDIFELYDFTYTDDIKVLAKEPRLVAVNNAMQVDLTGQANSEAIGPWPYTGPGGQTVFAISAAHSDQGRSIIVVPSSYVKDGKRCSRIVASLDAGAPVTVLRSAVDYVVTEFGIATMRGKTLRQRIGEMIAVAHPDCQAQLKDDAKQLYDWSF
ncbi:MAG: acetyl-CoA hydrolase/transferase family protein [Chloroflexi bacterium]|nr:acetyl-CoA hydrolase/transferase family protein [Chloroflexota bacterium]